MRKEVIQDVAVERRRGDRADRVVAISHRLFKNGSRHDLSDWSLSTTKNMSHSGLLFLSDVPYRIGAVLELHVVMSGMIDIFVGKAKIMRIIENGPRSFDVGVKYVQPKIQARSAKKHII
ncbi:MAG: PilZ domain-containing protein [Candidatus Omnitrophica bacterium]|nr:PilZ domain-containing protein [Candidatus Omnitrophota bacterium]